MSISYRSKQKKTKTVIPSEDEQLVLGVVYSPGVIDSQNDIMTAEEIKKMAYKFLASGSTAKIDVMHDFKESGSTVVQSFLARKGDPDFIEGSWVLGVKVDDDNWADVKAGKLNCFSLAADVVKQSAIVVVESLDYAKGITELSTADIVTHHSHDFFIEFDADGNVIKGETDYKLGHKHSITEVDSTEMVLDHGHRILLHTEED